MRTKVNISAAQKPGIFIKMLESYMNYMITVKGFSANTTKSYKEAYRRLITFMWEELHVNSNDITFDMLDIGTIEHFLLYLEDKYHNSVVTRNSRLAAIRSFAKYAVNHDFEAAAKFSNDMKKIEAKRSKQEERSYFTTEEVKILIDLPKLNTIAGRRDAVLLVFMFASGTRAQEVCDLKVKDLYFQSGGQNAWIKIHGKGRKDRTISVGAEVAALLRKYLRYRRIIDVPDAYVFNTQNNPQMSVSCLEEIFKKYIKLAKEQHPSLFKMDHYSPHSMRHSCAISMLAAGVPITIIRTFLGHAHVSTTEIYARVTQPSMEEAVLNWNKEFWSHIEQSPEEEVGSMEENDMIPDFLK